MIVRLLQLTLPVSLALSAPVGPVHGQAFDPAPLRVPIAMPSSGLPADPTQFMNWLTTSASTLTQDNVDSVREHLFAIISADAKRRHGEGTAVFPARGDSTLSALFAWADRLGLPGAAMVASALEPNGRRVARSQTPAPGIELHFDSVYTLLALDDGWRITFPHYFMIGNATRGTVASGVEVTTVVLSTLFAEDSIDASQATILILSAPLPAPEFTAAWLSRLGLQTSDTAAVPVPGAARAYRGVDAASRLSRELVVLAPEGRTILAIFAGVSGTDTANRPHFVNLLEGLRVRPREDQARPADEDR